MSSHRPPSTKKLCKVWNAKRDVSMRKCVVAGSLVELLQKGGAKLGLSDKGPLTAVLEFDGTIIDDDECFQMLGPECTFLLLKPGQQWKAHNFDSNRVYGEISIRNLSSTAGQL